MGFFSSIFKTVGSIFSSILGSLFSGPPEAPVAPPPQKPISPVTNRATQEGTIRRNKRRSFATTAGGSRSLLNDPTARLG